MNILLIIGRLAFVAIFVLSGAQKLMDVGATAAMIQPKIAVPEMLAGFAAQLEGATGMTTPQLLAIAAGVVELGGGLMIAANIGTRVAALALIIFTAAATFWFHDFWNMAGPDRMNNMIHALKNLSLIGALLVFFVIGPWRPEAQQGPAEPRF
jgi:putative oxidoreductase